MRYVLILAALLATALPLLAQKQPDQPAFDEAIDVRVVNVEAVVTGRDGERVRGLTKEDFRLLEASLTRLSPHDRIAIAAFDGKTLVRLADWTSDSRRISAALAAERARETDGLTPRVHLRMGFPDYGDRMSRAIDAAAAAMRGLPAPPGRKVMMLLTGDWPLVEIPTYGSLNARSRTWTDTAGEEMFRPLIDTANLLGYTLYPVDLPGFASGAGPGVEAMAPGPGTGLITSGWEMLTDYALNFLAQETGGKAAINSARLEALDRMAKDTGAYYWLGFTPDWQANDEHHRIELKPRQRGLRVRTRNGFTDLSCQTQVVLSEEGTLVSSPCVTPAR